MWIHEVLQQRTKCRVHLHVHLDGAVRKSTLWELCKAKSLPLPGSGSLSDLEEELRIRTPVDLAHFLERHSRWMVPVLTDDLTAIERVAYEFVEDEARQCVLYTEPRLCPHLLTSGQVTPDGGRVTARQVTEAALAGLARGQNQFGTKARLILCCLWGRTETYQEVLDLCTEFQGRVVGIDLAGDEGSTLEEVEVFREAEKRGIHRTAHVSQTGPANMVQVAIDEMHVERVGHGYHVLEDPQLYSRCLAMGERVHFECCPWSSLLTGSVPLTQTKHPVQRFCEDGLNFSVNVDDPTVTQTGLEDEYDLLRQMGFTEANIATVNFNAARASFLPPDEKQQLLKQLKKAYGFPDTD